MLDFILAVGQFLCFAGLVYGAILTLSNRDCVDTLRPFYDPVTGHDWLNIRHIRNEAQVHAPAAAEKSPALTDSECLDELGTEH